MTSFSHAEPRAGVLSLAGELTWQGAAELKPLLLGLLGSHERVEIDLLNVTKLDTAGVQLLIMMQAEAARLDKQIVWLGYSLAVEEVMDLLDLRDLFGEPKAVVWS